MTIDKRKVVYQIYPKSYKDTTGNGVGDLRGIIEKLPYLAELGIDMVWLNPFYPSPQRDNGYDISDYTAINPDFGKMDDFEEMIEVGRQYRIDFMLDMVLNHCSIEHEWFKKHLQEIATIKISLSYVIIQQIGYLNLVEMLGHHLVIQGSIIFIFLISLKLTLIGAMPMFARNFLKLSIFGVIKGLKVFDLM